MILWYGKLFYGAGALSYAAVAQTCMGLLMLFATDAHNVPAWLAGIALAIGFVFSAAADPVTACLSDRTKSVMFGKRFAFILCGIFLTALFNILLFTMPAGIHAGLKFLWLTVFVSLLNIFISLIYVPHSSLASELAGDKRELGRITGYRKVFFLISLALPTLLLGLVIPDTWNAAGYETLAFVNSAVVVIAGLLSFFACYPHLPRLNAKSLTEGYSVRPPLKELRFKDIFSGFFRGLSVRDCRHITLGYTVSTMSVAFLTGAGLHFLRYTMDFSTAQMAGALSALFLFIIVSQPVWVRLAKKYDKKPLILSGTIIALTGILLICVIFAVYHYANASGNPLYLFIAGMAVIGAGSGAMHAIPAMMLSDSCGDKQDKEPHTRNMSFMFKAAQAAVMVVAGILLTAFGFKGGGRGQTALTEGALGWIAILGASLALGIAVYFYMQVGRMPKPKKAETVTETVAEAEQQEIDETKETNQTQGTAEIEDTDSVEGNPAEDDIDTAKKAGFTEPAEGTENTESAERTERTEASEEESV